MADELIINGITVDDVTDKCCEIKIGEQVLQYVFKLLVIKNSKCDKELMKVKENPNKYKVEINVVEVK